MIFQSYEPKEALKVWEQCPPLIARLGKREHRIRIVQDQDSASSHLGCGGDGDPDILGISCPEDAGFLVFVLVITPEVDDMLAFIVVEVLVAARERLDRRERGLDAGGGVEEVRVADFIGSEHPAVAREDEAPLLVRRAGEGDAEGGVGGGAVQGGLLGPVLVAGVEQARRLLQRG